MSARVDLLERDGRWLAVAMLHELEDAETIDGYMLDPACWDDGATEQNNVLLRHLDALRASGSRAAEVGFTAILTDYISSCVGGAIPDAAFYMKMPFTA